MSTTAQKPQKFDLVVIGGGPAGYVAAMKGRMAGFRVALVEKDKIGGACVNKGCIPTKALWGTAVHLQRLKDSEEHGVSIGKVQFDFAKAMQRQYGISAQMSLQIEGRMGRLGVNVFKGKACLAGRTKSGRFINIHVDGKPKLELTARHVLVATGSHPSQSAPLVSDGERVLTTDDIIGIEKQPKSLLIAGGGVVACEFASIFSKFGTKVDLLEHSGQILSWMDPEIVDVMMEVYKRDGVNIHLHSKTKTIERTPKHVRVTIEKAGKEEVLEPEMMLLAIGRKPNVKDMGLDEMGIKFTERGHIDVNERLETACKGVYAAGDVVGGAMLAHKAWYDADIAIRAMAGEEVRTNYETVPGAIFTVPEMASVGITPEQARKNKKSIRIGKFEYRENAQALCVGKTLGMIKAVIDRDSGKVLGCSMVGHDASNLISEVALAMAAGLSVQDIANTIHPHPTLSEMVQEAFLDTEGRSIHKF